MITVRGPEVTLDQVKKIVLQRPSKAGSHWAGVSHGELIGALLNAATERQWAVYKMRFAVSKDGHSDLAAAFDVVLPGVDMPAGNTLGLGLLNSNSRKRSLRLVVGTTVSVCSNGVIGGELLMDRKHVRGFDFRKSIPVAMDRYEKEAGEMPGMIERLQETELDDRTVDQLLMEAGRRRLMPFSWLGKVDREYAKPRFKEFRPRTAWSLLNAFTYYAKRNPPLRQMEQSNRFRQLLEETVYAVA